MFSALATHSSPYIYAQFVKGVWYSPQINKTKKKTSSGMLVIRNQAVLKSEIVCPLPRPQTSVTLGENIFNEKCQNVNVDMTHRRAQCALHAHIQQRRGEKKKKT